MRRKRNERYICPFHLYLERRNKIEAYTAHVNSMRIHVIEYHIHNKPHRNELVFTCLRLFLSIAFFV